MQKMSLAFVLLLAFGTARAAAITQASESDDAAISSDDTSVDVEKALEDSVGNVPQVAGTPGKKSSIAARKAYEEQADAAHAEMAQLHERMASLKAPEDQDEATPTEVKVEAPPAQEVAVQDDAPALALAHHYKQQQDALEHDIVHKLESEVHESEVRSDKTDNDAIAVAGDVVSSDVGLTADGSASPDVGVTTDSSASPDAGVTTDSSSSPDGGVAAVETTSPDFGVAATKTAAAPVAKTATDVSFDSTENAIGLLHKQYADEKKGTKRLRIALAKAQESGNKLQKELSSETESHKEKENQAQVFLARKEKDATTAMAIEKKREHLLGSEFVAANRSLVERTRKLAEEEQELNSTKQEQTSLSASALRALRAERNQTINLQAEVKKAKVANVELRNQLDHANGDLAVARTEWRAEEVRLLQSKAQEDSQRKHLEANLTKASKVFLALRAAKQKQDALVNIFRKKTKQGLSEVKTKLNAARNREASLHKILDRDRKEKGQHEASLQKDIALWKQRAESEQTNAQQLQHELKMRARGDLDEVSDRKQKLKTESKESQKLQKERSRIEDEIRGNATKSKRLEDQVARLRHQLQEIETARKAAEAKAAHAQEDTAKAQAVAKQLSGSVPRLLEQAQLAHEARDVEDAKRAQAQVTANIVQHQEDELHKDARMVAAMGVKDSSSDDTVDMTEPSAPSHEVAATHSRELLTEPPAPAQDPSQDAATQLNEQQPSAEDAIAQAPAADEAAPSTAEDHSSDDAAPASTADDSLWLNQLNGEDDG